ncbi:MAG TPA: putative metal-binding motif-containing protein, partial [Polyangiaceae bacterium]|nr:putative metal-binding motif-containing protein [Polyangiaceae bacterium]
MRPLLFLTRPRLTRSTSLITSILVLAALGASCTVQGTGYVPQGDGDGDSPGGADGGDGDAAGGSTSGDGDGDGDGSGGTSGGGKCEEGDERPCNDCGRQVCDEETLMWGACAPDAEPSCLDGGEREVCDESGHLVTEACENDETNCSVSCEDVDGVGTCVYTALDRDDDGYASAACAAAPGDDCDDTTNLVSPTSPETCDGRDNDCDGHRDVLDKSVDLTRSPVRLGVNNGVSFPLYNIDVTWHESEFFLVATGVDPYEGVYSGYARTDGTAALNEEMLFGADSVTVQHSARVASTGDTLGALVMHDGRSGQGLGFSVLDPAGTVIESLGGFDARSHGTITADESDFFISGTNAPNGANPDSEFHHIQINPAGDVSAPLFREDISGSIGYPNSAQSGGSTLTVYSDSSTTPPTVQLMRASGGALQGPIQLSAAGQMADVTALTSGNVAIAWATAEGFAFEVRRSNGTTVQCSTTTPFGNGSLDELDSVGIAQSSLGIMVLAADSGGTVGKATLFVFDEDCSLLSEEGDDLYYSSELYDPHDNELPYLPRLAVGGGHVALTWTAQMSNGSEESRVWAYV